MRISILIASAFVLFLIPLNLSAQLYDPADAPQQEQKLRVFIDQYGRKIYMNSRNEIVRTVEPQSYPDGVTPPPLGIQAGGPVGGGQPYDGFSGVRDESRSGLPDINAPAIEMPKGPESRKKIAALQVLLDRVGASPGAIDGVVGSNFDKAAAAAGEISGRFIDPNDMSGIDKALQETGGPAFISYTLTPEDVNQNYVASIPTDYALKAQMPAMAFTSVREMLAEKFHIDENYLQMLNPSHHFTQAGEVITVPNIKRISHEPVVRIVADKARKQVRGYNSQGRLIVAYPSTIGSSDNPSPSGTVQVERIAFNPNYTYNPKLNFKQGENESILTIPPGPNGPVGTVWIALSKPTYGIHGTPEPSRIGKTSSHGCIRLTNWDAKELAHLVKKGVTVEFVD